MKRWRCKVCGYVHTGDEPPEECPVCGAPKSEFELLDDEDAEKDKIGKSSKRASSLDDQAWKCEICGFIHRGGEAPKECPVCAASKDKFVPHAIEPITTSPGLKDYPSDKPSAAQPVSEQTLTRTIKPISQLVAKAELLTKLHGHPIAVHIPNGVLPVTLFFTLLAMLFKSEPLAVTAKYNCIVVAISMPLVLITGFIDWFNRFGGRLTSVFKIKIVCGLIVTSLTLVLALWWTTDSQIYLAGRPGHYIFLLINVVDFLAAAVAGFYGGKLVFRD